MNINLTLFAQMIAFALFAGFCMRYVWPPIMKALEARTVRIAEGLAAAERGAHEQELGRKKALETIGQAKTDAAEILAQAQKRYNELLEEAKNDALAEAARIKTAAHAEIDLEANRAREELRERMAALAVAAAEKILQKDVDASAHRALLDSFAKQL